MHQIQVSTLLSRGSRLRAWSLCLFACFTLGHAASPAQAEESKPMAAKVGHSFTLALASNPTTGYQWRLAKPLDGKCLRLLTNHFVRSQSKLAGAAGQQVWKFQPLRAGKTELALEYVRSWETEAKPAQTTNIWIVISR